MSVELFIVLRFWSRIYSSAAVCRDIRLVIHTWRLLNGGSHRPFFDTDLTCDPIVHCASDLPIVAIKRIYILNLRRHINSKLKEITSNRDVSYLWIFTFAGFFRRNQVSLKTSVFNMFDFLRITPFYYNYID